MADNLVDCDAGRRLGCATFCCRLLVRLDQSERESGAFGPANKNCLDKAPDGRCIHLDRENHRCGIWSNRPRVCREYTCDGDPMFEAALRFGVTNIVQLSRDALTLRSTASGSPRVPNGICGKSGCGPS